jgi:hypothetical protein
LFSFESISTPSALIISIALSRVVLMITESWASLPSSGVVAASVAIPSSSTASSLSKVSSDSTATDAMGYLA